MIDNGLSKVRKYVQLASKIDYQVQPPHAPVQINDVDKITPEIIMNTIMAAHDKLRADWITFEKNQDNHIQKGRTRTDL